jgi:hypothetical protein
MKFGILKWSFVKRVLDTMEFPIISENIATVHQSPKQPNTKFQQKTRRNLIQELNSFIQKLKQK